MWIKFNIDMITAHDGLFYSYGWLKIKEKWPSQAPGKCDIQRRKTPRRSQLQKEEKKIFVSRM